MIAADLEYAKSMAVSRQKTYKVIFDTDAESYSLTDANEVVITHPVNAGKPYAVNFKSDSRVSQVNIDSVNFAGNSYVEFDYLGSPNSGGVVTLKGGGKTVTVAVEEATGFISVSN
jgi:hypothetical protein